MDLMEKEKLEQKVEESRKSYAQNGHLKDFDEDFIRAEIKWEMLLEQDFKKGLIGGYYEKVYGGNVKERK